MDEGLGCDVRMFMGLRLLRYGLLMMNLEVAAAADPRSAAGNRWRFPFLRKPFENQGNRTGKGQKRCSFGSRICGCLGFKHNLLGAFGRITPCITQATDRICTGIAGFTRTHNLRPAERPTDKRRTGNTCSTTELLRRVVPKAGLEPATTS